MISFFCVLKHFTKCQWYLIWLSFDFICVLCVSWTKSRVEYINTYTCRRRYRQRIQTRTLSAIFSLIYSIIAHTFYFHTPLILFRWLCFYCFLCVCLCFFCTEHTSPESAQYIFSLWSVVCLLSCLLYSKVSDSSSSGAIYNALPIHCAEKRGDFTSETKNTFQWSYAKFDISSFFPSKFLRTPRHFNHSKDDFISYKIHHICVMCISSAIAFICSIFFFKSFILGWDAQYEL